jgi:hypothetical protein
MTCAEKGFPTSACINMITPPQTQLPFSQACNAHGQDTALASTS